MIRTPVTSIFQCPVANLLFWCFAPPPPKEETSRGGGVASGSRGGGLHSVRSTTGFSIRAGIDTPPTSQNVRAEIGPKCVWARLGQKVVEFGGAVPVWSVLPPPPDGVGGPSPDVGAGGGLKS